mgnify:CR=1 FL=1
MRIPDIVTVEESQHLFMVITIQTQGGGLRFMTNGYVPFTNNAAGNSIRMTEVQQKIWGCFRSTQSAEMFCRVRGYLSTCRQQGGSATEAMTLVFERKLPGFSL